MKNLGPHIKSIPYPSQPVALRIGGGQPQSYLQSKHAQVEQQSDQSQINSMLNEFEKTKNLNKELLMLRNFGAASKQPRQQ